MNTRHARVVWDYIATSDLSFRIVQTDEDRGYKDNRVYVVEVAEKRDAMGAPLWTNIEGSIPKVHAEFYMRLARDVDRFKGLVAANEAARAENR